MSAEKPTNIPQGTPQKTMYQRIMAGEKITTEEEQKFLKTMAEQRVGARSGKFVWDDDHGNELARPLFPELVKNKKFSW